MICRNIFFISFLLLLLAAHPPLLSALPENDSTNATGAQHGSHARKRALLESLNKPYIKTIEELLLLLFLPLFVLVLINKLAFFVVSCSEPDGDTIDCVPTHLQLAFDHPKLRGLKPLELPELPEYYESDGATDNLSQLWRMAEETCPEGTVPIRRTKEEDVTRVERFGRKTMAMTRANTSFSDHEHSYAQVTGSLYFGAEAIFNIWRPIVAAPNEFSLSQLWVVSGTFGSNLNTIEVGWQVYPNLYGDTSPRLFVYWTRNSYRSTGCYNLLCPRFVQVSNKIMVGAALTPMSIYNDVQYEARFTVWKDQPTGNWWLRVGTTMVGYWPKFLFTNIDGGATIVEYGGEIINSHPSGHHTLTQMGSGHFAGEGFGKAAYIRNLALVNNKNTLYPVNKSSFNAEAPTCYNIQGFVGSNWGTYFFFGGPGRNPNCP